MRYMHVRLVLTFIGWLSSGGISALAQDTTRVLLPPPFEDTAIATRPGEAPTPQFLRVMIGLEAGSRTLRLSYDPAWVAVHSPHVRVRLAPIQRAPAADGALSPRGGGDALRQTLEQALAGAQPAAALSP
jgi:hypothetical protein